MGNVESAGNARILSILYTSESAKRLADCIRLDLEWLLELKIEEAEPAPAAMAPPGVSQIILSVLLTPHMKTAWKAVIFSLRRSLSKKYAEGVGGRLILRDISGEVKASFLFQGSEEMLGIGDSVKNLMSA